MQHEQSFKNTNIDGATQRGKPDTPKYYNLNQKTSNKKPQQRASKKHITQQLKPQVIPTIQESTTQPIHIKT